MIKVDLIEEDFDGNAKRFLEDIQQEYFDQVNRSARPFICKQFATAISEKKVINPRSKEVIYQLNDDEIVFLCYLYKNLKDLLSGNLSKLVKLIDEIEGNSSYQNVLFKSDKKRSNFSLKALNKLLDFDAFRNRISGGVWLAKRLNIKACPYCNSQFTLLVGRKDKKYDKGFHFDHYFPRSKYPYLAISLYNLIPSCASCNQKKSDKDVDLQKVFHPYYKNLHHASEFTVDYPFNLEKMHINALLEIPHKDFKISFSHRFGRYRRICKETR